MTDKAKHDSYASFMCYLDIRDFLPSSLTHRISYSFRKSVIAKISFNNCNVDCSGVCDSFSVTPTTGMTWCGTSSSIIVYDCVIHTTQAKSLRHIKTLLVKKNLGSRTYYTSILTVDTQATVQVRSRKGNT